MRCIALRGLGIAMAVLLLARAHPAAAQPYVYVANLGSHDVSVLDAATNALAATLPAGEDPNGVAVAPDGTRVYVTNFISGTLTIIDAAANRVVGTLPVGDGPVGAAVSTDGATVYIANRGGNEVAVVNPAVPSVSARIPVGAGPNAVAVTPDGRSAYVTNSFTGFPGEVSVLDLATNAVRDTVAVQRAPNRVAVSPDGTRVYVTNFRSWNLSIIDTATDAVAETLRVGDKPTSVAVNPNGAYAYVTLQYSQPGNLQIVETATNRVTDSLAAGYHPRAVASDRRGGTGYVANFYGDSVTVLDLGDQSVRDEIAVGSLPFAVGVNCVGSACDAPPFTPHSTKTVTMTPTVPTPTATPTVTLTPTFTRTPTRTATLRPGLEHVVIEAGSASGPPGSRRTVDVSLHTGGQTVHGVTHAIEFTDTVRIAERAPGVPACALDAGTDATARFEFVPEGCSYDCTHLRIAIAAPDALFGGTVLYRCAVDIAPWASIGTQRLRNVEVGAGGPHGEALATRGRDGIVSVVQGPTPTATVVREPDVFLRLGSVSGRPGDRVSLTFHLEARGNEIAGVQSDTFFNEAGRIAARADGDPDCSVNPAIDKDGSAFAFQPFGCSGEHCEAVRALVLSLENTDPIADGALLYTCQFAIAADAAPGNYRLDVRDVGASDPDGNAVPAAADGGVLTVLGSGAQLQAGFAPDLTRVCSGGARDSMLCADDEDCQGGSCRAVHGVCDGGDDDGLLCDCPGGTCSGQSACAADAERGTCMGGVLDSQCCARAFNCDGGAACVRTAQLCASGPSKGLPCLDDHHCMDAHCVASPRVCAGGSFHRANCIDDTGCPLGACVSPTPIPTEGTPRTPTPTRRLTPILPWDRCAHDSECVTGFCTDGVCCEVRTCPIGQVCASGSGKCSESKPTPTASRLPTLPPPNPCGSCPSNRVCNPGPPPLCIVLTSNDGGGCSTAGGQPAVGNLVVVFLLPLALWFARRLR